MPQSLPPLNALRAFEAVARLGSYTHAADELCVTHSAVSQQVKQLEQYLGLKLFDKKGNRIMLSEIGRHYADTLGSAFSSIKQATAHILRHDDPNVLTINLANTFAMNWLIPRLDSLQEQYPRLEIRLSSPSRKVNFQLETIDVAIYTGDGKWPGAKTELLYDDEIFPVCSAEFLQQHGPIDFMSPGILDKLIYIDASYTKHDWLQWYKSVGLEKPRRAKKLVFKNLMHALQAVNSGLGIAMAHKPPVMDALASGLLVKAHEQSLKLKTGYYLVYPEASLEKRKVKNFRDWVLKEAGCEM